MGVIRWGTMVWCGWCPMLSRADRGFKMTLKNGEHDLPGLRDGVSEGSRQQESE